jgi:hypothetical protein
MRGRGSTKGAGRGPREGASGHSRVGVIDPRRPWAPEDGVEHCLPPAGTAASTGGTHLAPAPQLPAPVRLLTEFVTTRQARHRAPLTHGLTCRWPACVPDERSGASALRSLSAGQVPPARREDLGRGRRTPLVRTRTHTQRPPKPCRGRPGAASPRRSCRHGPASLCMLRRANARGAGGRVDAQLACIPARRSRSAATATKRLRCCRARASHPPPSSPFVCARLCPCPYR